MPIQKSSHENNEIKNGSARHAIADTADDLRKDLGTLQSDVAALASDVRKTGSDKARMAVNYVNEQVGSLKDTGMNALVKVEEGIKSNPGQSVALAFVAGFLVSFLFGRKY